MGRSLRVPEARRGLKQLQSTHRARPAPAQHPEGLAVWQARFAGADRSCRNNKGSSSYLLPGQGVRVRTWSLWSTSVWSFLG